MTKRQEIRQTKRNKTSINPQGYSEDVANQETQSQLEQRAKKKNTKI